MRWIRARDLFDALLLLGLLPFSWLLPQRSWQAFTSLLARVHVALAGSRAAGLDGELPAGLGVTARELELGFRQHNYWELMELLREHAPCGWRVSITLAGREHIEAALAAGRGAVLWYCPFTHADVVFKRGFHEAGYQLHHLSSLTHGFSDTRFGLAVLNPLKTAVESRYLQQRCVIGDTGAGRVIRELLDTLRNNGLVSVTAVQTGRHVGARPLFGGTLRLAKGAPSFAASTGAALLPIFVVPSESGYMVQVEPPMQAASDAIAAREEEYVAAYVAVLERYVTRYPTLWRGWFGSPTYWVPGEFGSRRHS